jgi:hypothetical protein
MDQDGTEQNDVSALHPELLKVLTEAWEQWAQRTHVYPDPRGK